MNRSNRTRAAEGPGRSLKGAQLRTLRESVGLSQTAAAARIGVSLRTWQGWEGDEVAVHPATCRYIESVFSSRAEDWFARTYPDGWDGEKRISWQEQERLLHAYRAGQLSG